MDARETNTPGDAPGPRTVTVLGFLVTTAFVLSYLGSYALTSALVARDILQQWSPGADPRPRWLGLGFVSVLAVLGATGFVIRLASRRQLRSIDALADETEDFRMSDA